MRQGTRVKLLGLLVVLAVVAGILGIPASHPAHALFCCSQCDSLYSQCLTGSVYPQCNGNGSCCLETLSTCYNTCNDGC